MRRRLMCVAMAVASVVALAPRAEAAPFVIGGTAYVETGLTEIVSATFLAADGGASTAGYSGFVKLTVSGSGQSDGTCLNDAFYVYTCGLFSGAFYQLAADSAPLVPFNNFREVRYFTYYDVDANVEVAPLYTPAYRNDHIYSFIIDTGLVAPGLLHFGVSDGNFGDNSGAYRVEVTQLAAVPEPASILLMGVAVAGLASRRFRGPRRAS